MIINWAKAPDDYPIWIEGFGVHTARSGWYRRSGYIFESKSGGELSAHREGQFFNVHIRPEFDYLPPLESTVRIVPGTATIWDVAEQFVGVDCRLKAVFMLEETQMVAVECIESGQCCCFWASMVRTPEQAKAEERMNKAIALYTAVMNHPSSSLWHRLDSERQEHFLSLVDAGWQQVKP